MISLFGLMLLLLASSLDAAAVAAGMTALDGRCSADADEQQRLWLLEGDEPVYLLRLLEEPARGDFLRFDWVDGGQVESCRLDRGRAYHWRAIALSLEHWEALDRGLRERGAASSLSLIVERCSGGAYDRTAYGDPTDLPEELRRAVSTVVGLVLYLDEYYTDDPCED